MEIVEGAPPTRRGMHSGRSRWRRRHDERAWGPLLTTLGYPVGYLIVILGSHQLFTDNTLMPIVPLLAQPSRSGLPNVLRLWTAVLVANLIGAFLFATVLAQLGVIDPLVHQALGEIAREALGGESVAWGALLTGFLVPSLLGNELGGLAMVAALNHAQLTSSEEGA